MLEESIDSSPNSLDSSIRRKREHRKTKRRRLDELLQRSNPIDEQKILQMYCDDSDQEESVAPVREQNTFKRFQAENMIANADRFDVPPQVKKVPELMQLTQEFWTCERLMETQVNEIEVASAQTPQGFHLDTSFLSCQSVVDNTRVNFDDAWILEGFEDDMILQTNECQVKKIDENSSLDKTLVPNACDRTILESRAHWEHNIEAAFVDWFPTEHVNGKTIVETILEDFCTSTDSTESELNSEDVMPFFRFRRKKIRTYERCWRRNTRCASINVAVTYKADEDGLSDGSESSSNLSIQEDKSQVLPKVEPLQHLNTSSRIRNNLLNLSAFFTQNIVDSDEAEDSNNTASEENNDTDIIAVGVSGYEAIKQLITEILTLRAKYPISYGFVNARSNENFHGFPSNEETTDDGGDADIELKSRNKVCRSAPILLQSCTSASQHLKTISTKDHVDSCNNNQNYFDEDSWHHDSDFFANFQTQTVLREANTAITKTRRKSDSTLTLAKQKKMSKQPNESTPSKLKTHRLIVPQVDDNIVNQPAINIDMNVVESLIPVEDILKLFENPRNISLRESTEKAETSKVLESDFDCMLLSEWPLDEKVSVTKLNVLNEEVALGPQVELETLSPSIKDEFLIPKCVEEKSRTTNECMSFEGFQTASRKAIKISEEARKKGDNIFAELPDLPGEKTKSSIRNSMETKSVISDSSSENKETSGAACFSGFQTASRKVINVSEEAQKKIKSVFDQLPDLPGEKTKKTIRNSMESKNVISDFSSENKETSDAACFTGFQTASRKAINISEEAQKKIKSVFDQLPDLPGEKTKKTIRNSMESKNVISDFSSENKETSGAACFSGFQTASRKVINVSEEAQKKIKSVFDQLPDLPGEKTKKTIRNSMESKNVISDFSSENKETSDAACFTGFQTASRKAINISEEAQKKIKSVFDQLPDLPGEKTKKTIRNSMESKNVISDFSSENKETSGAACFSGFQTASRKVINVSEEAQKKIKSVFDQLPDLPGEKTKKTIRNSMESKNVISDFSSENKETSGAACFSGFQTASRKVINVSEEAQKKIKSVFDQLPDLPGEKTKKTIRNSMESKNVISDFSSENKETSGAACFSGFQTASRKVINVSEEAQKKIKSVFDQLPDLPGEKTKKTIRNSMETKSIISDSSSENKETSGAACFTGFQTASRKAINVSEEAQKKIESVFAHLPDLPSEKTETASKNANISNELMKKSGDNYGLHGKEHANKSFATKQSENFEDLTNIPFSEWIPNCESPLPKQSAEIKIEPDLSMKRRLHTIDNEQNNEQPNKILCRSHTTNENSAQTPISSNRSSELKKTLSHVPNSKLIGRRNLLSLTKRRRESLRLENNIKHEATDSVETPVKLLPAVVSSKNILAPQTPQGNEFFAQSPAAASTPQQFGVMNTPVQISKNSTDNLDFYFKRINWESTDDHHVNDEHLSATPTRANNSGLNKSLKPQPSPQERIENLSSCGDPPPLPQLVDSNSRSRNLGMSRRRRRCAIKK